MLFTNYSIKSSADKLLVYITLFLSSCLKRECCALQLKLNSRSATEIVLQSMLSFCCSAGLSDSKPCREEAERLLFTLAHETFRLPGEFGFCLGGLVSAPINKQEAGATEHHPRSGACCTSI